MWLVTNDASGSNEAEAIAAIESTCGESGLHIAHRTRFPAQELPGPALLDAAEIDHLAIFTGDGTLNAALDASSGWAGSALVLPGGTMNLLYRRLFGAMDYKEVLLAVARGSVALRRPGIVTSPLGNAYAGLLAGPGTSWNPVREAMRDNDLLEMATEAREAIANTLGGEMIVCREPPLGRAEGYPLLLLSPHDDGMRLKAYFAETPLEYLDQALALMRRDFREGPHELLGTGERFTLASQHGGGFGVLMDGEPVAAEGATEFALAPCPVDLLAARHDG